MISMYHKTNLPPITGSRSGVTVYGGANALYTEPHFLVEISISATLFVSQSQLFVTFTFRDPPTVNNIRFATKWHVCPKRGDSPEYIFVHVKDGRLKMWMSSYVTPRFGSQPPYK